MRLLLEEGLRLMREVNNRWGMAYALRQLGQFILEQGDMVTALMLFTESVLYYREVGDRRGVALSHMLQANVAANQGDVETARKLYEESLVIARELDLKEIIASCLVGLGNLVVPDADLISQPLPGTPTVSPANSSVHPISKSASHSDELTTRKVEVGL